MIFSVYNLQLRQGEAPLEPRSGRCQRTRPPPSQGNQDREEEVKDPTRALRSEDASWRGESHEGVPGVLVSRPRAWPHSQGHSHHDQDVGRVPQPEKQPSGWLSEIRKWKLTVLHLSLLQIRVFSTAERRSFGTFPTLAWTSWTRLSLTKAARRSTTRCTWWTRGGQSWWTSA